MHTVLSLKKRLSNFISKNNKRVSDSLQLYFLERMERLLTNGYSVIDALDIMAWDKKLTPFTTMMKKTLRKGKPIDIAFKHSHFHHMIVSYLYFVRYNGNLLYSLTKCRTMFAKRLHYMNKLRQTLRYPLFLSFIFTAILIFLKRSILPSFQQLFQSSQTSTKYVSLSFLLIDSLTTICILFIVGAFIATFCWFVIRKQFPIEKEVRMYEKIPIVRSIIKLYTSLHMASHIAMFLQAGLSLKETVEQLKRQNQLVIVRFYAEKMAETLQKGLSLSPLLNELSLIDEPLAHIIEKNERVESLVKDLFAYSDFITDYLDRLIQRAITLIQPIFFAVLALLIIFVYLSLFIPMFQTIKSI